MRRTRIICTLGPVSETEDGIRGLARAGMDVARLNFSHGEHAWHAERLECVRRVAEEVGRPLAVLQDLSGPKLRVGSVPEEGLRLHSGSECVLTRGSTAAGQPPRLEVPVPELLAALAPGHHVSLADGMIDLRVESLAGGDAHCRVAHGGLVRSHVGISAPSVPMAIAAFSSKDEADLRFGARLGVDWVALSFVRRASDLDAPRACLRELGADTPLMAKIEKPEAVENLEEIAAAADGLMVARGDLGVELPLEEVPIVQKRIIALCNALGKPVVTATQMLESMTQNPRPTRAEVSDVANAILDGTDAVMLSAETAVGCDPAAAAGMMARIAGHTEAHFEYRRVLSERISEPACTSTDAIAQGACEIAADLGAAAILCSTTSGATARAVARMRPSVPVVATTPNLTTLRRLALTWGVTPLLVAATTDTDERMAAAVQAARAGACVRPGVRVVIVLGAPVGTPGHTNLIKVQVV